MPLLQISFKGYRGAEITDIQSVTIKKAGTAGEYRITSSNKSLTFVEGEQGDLAVAHYRIENDSLLVIREAGVTSAIITGVWDLEIVEVVTTTKTYTDITY